MEIEAKFRVPNLKIARELRRVPVLADYSFGGEKTFVVRDSFYDTADRRLARAKYMLRVRHRNDGRVIVTLKGASKRRAAIHRRMELEAIVPTLKRGRITVRDLPEGDLSKKMHSLIGDESIAPFLTNHQTRGVHLVYRKQHLIGEWSLDHVQFRAGARRRAFYELEIELKEDGTERDLRALSKIVQAQWRLTPVTKSKFERALEFMHFRYRKA